VGGRSSLLDGHGDDFAWSLFDAAPDAILVVASDGEIAFANDPAAAVFHCTIDDLLGSSVESLVPSEHREAHVAQREGYVRHPRTRPMGSGIQLEAVRPDGTRFPAEISLSPLRLDGQTFTVAAVRDISERVEAEHAYQRSQDALRQAEMRMAIAEDRDRIARDLHDTVIQRLFGTGLSLQAAASIAEEPLRARLEAAVADLDEMIFELRTTIFSLQGSRTIAGGLRGELLDVATETGVATGVDVRVQFDGPIESLDDRIAEHLVPVLREALTNVAKHAQARQARVSLTVGDEVVLVVADDGVGTSGEVYGGSGLANLAARAEELGGSSSLSPGPNGGSRLEWRVPRA
jgi:two-component system sensor histidine kinase DevS